LVSFFIIELLLDEANSVIFKGSKILKDQFVKSDTANSVQAPIATKVSGKNLKTSIKKPFALNKAVRPLFDLKEAYRIDLIGNFENNEDNLDFYPIEYFCLKDLTQDLLFAIKNLIVASGFEQEFIKDSGLEDHEFKFSPKKFHQLFINNIIDSILLNSKNDKLISKISDSNSLFYNLLYIQMTPEAIIALLHGLKEESGLLVAVSNGGGGGSKELDSGCVTATRAGSEKTDTHRKYTFKALSYIKFSELIKKHASSIFDSAAIDKVLRQIQMGIRCGCKHGAVHTNGSIIDAWHVSTGIKDAKKCKSFTVFYQIIPNILPDGTGENSYKLLALGRHGGKKKTQITRTYELWVTDESFGNFADLV
jgi:hypothetical protein